MRNKNNSYHLKKLLKKIDQKFFFDLNGLTENIKNAKKYGTSMEFYGKLVANFLGYKFKNSIENPFALNSMGIYSLVNSSHKQILDMKDLVSDYEPLLIAIFKQSWKEFNLDKEKTSLNEPFNFQSQIFGLKLLKCMVFILFLDE